MTELNNLLAKIDDRRRVSVIQFAFVYSIKTICSMNGHTQYIAIAIAVANVLFCAGVNFHNKHTSKYCAPKQTAEKRRD